MTINDQKLINKIKRSMQMSKKKSKDSEEKQDDTIIIIHNLKDVRDKETMEECVKKQLKAV